MQVLPTVKNVCWIASQCFSNARQLMQGSLIPWRLGDLRQPLVLRMVSRSTTLRIPLHLVLFLGPREYQLVDRRVEIPELHLVDLLAGLVHIIRCNRRQSRQHFYDCPNKSGPSAFSIIEREVGCSCRCSIITYCTLGNITNCNSNVRDCNPRLWCIRCLILP